MTSLCCCFCWQKAEKKKTFDSRWIPNVITRYKATGVESKPKTAHRWVKEGSGKFFRFFFWHKFWWLHSASYCLIGHWSFGRWRTEKSRNLYFDKKFYRCANLGYFVGLQNEKTYLTPGFPKRGQEQPHTLFYHFPNKTGF